MTKRRIVCSMVLLWAVLAMCTWAVLNPALYGEVGINGVWQRQTAGVAGAAIDRPWASPVQVPPHPAVVPPLLQSISSVSLALDGSGNAYAVWEAYALGDWILFAYRPAQPGLRRRFLAGGWSVPVSLDRPSAFRDGVRRGSPSIAVDSAGNAYSVWAEWMTNPGLLGSGPSALSVRFSHRSAGGAWTVDERISNVAGRSKGPSIAADASGDVFAVWGYDSGLRVSHRSGDGSWSPTGQVIDVAGAEPGLSRITVGANGDALAAWVDYRLGSKAGDIYSAYRPSTGDWGPNAKVNDDVGGAEHIHPSLAVDAKGNAYAVWEDERNGDADIYFAFRPQGGAWGHNVRVNDDEGPAGQYGPEIAVDASGNAFVLWGDRRDNGCAVYFSFRPAGGPWGTNMKVAEQADRHCGLDVSLAVDGGGTSYALWSSGRALFFSYWPASEADAPQDQASRTALMLASGLVGLVGAAMFAVAQRADG